MTRKICVLGNSHIAALKGGWADGGAHDKFTPEFFGALSKGMASLAFIDGKIIPQDAEAAEFFCNISGKENGADPNEYDAFLLCGMGMNLSPIFNNYGGFATPDTHHSIPDHFVSDTCLQDLLWDHIDNSMMMHCARLVRRITDAPVYLVWQAFFAENLFDIEWRAAQIGPILENNDQEYVVNQMRLVSDRLSTEGFQILHQPLETIAQGIMTKSEFSRGSVLFREGLDKPHRENDVFHMNSQYGVRCWHNWDI